MFRADFCDQDDALGTSTNLAASDEFISFTTDYFDNRAEPGWCQIDATVAGTHLTGATSSTQPPRTTSRPARVRAARRPLRGSDRRLGRDADTHAPTDPATRAESGGRTDPDPDAAHRVDAAPLPDTDAHTGRDGRTDIHTHADKGRGDGHCGRAGRADGRSCGSGRDGRADFCHGDTRSDHRPGLGGYPPADPDGHGRSGVRRGRGAARLRDGGAARGAARLRGGDRGSLLVAGHPDRPVWLLQVLHVRVAEVDL